MKINLTALKAIYLHKWMIENFDTISIISCFNNLTTLVFGSVVGGYIEKIDGISYGSYVPGLLMLTLLTQSISNILLEFSFQNLTVQYEILAAPISTLEVVLAFVGAGQQKH